MEPFKITPLDNTAYSRYPAPYHFLSSVDSLSKEEIAPYLRLHLFEGVPFFLRDKPLVYEVGREWLSRKLEVDPRSIIVIGSSSIGFSMSPPPDFGRPFSDKSDIDLSIISEALFTKLELTFYKWKEEYERGTVIPTTQEKKYWDLNLSAVPKNINRGFVDTYKVPNRYAASTLVNDALYRLSEKTRLTLSRETKIKLSARVYKNWKCFYKQFKINFEHALSKLDEKHRVLLMATKQQ